ncbi:hypothetical protein [Catellatospora sichuanensis]|uniref:hypothetical protein n=1 Tax=Catellatospora sichuanensis TaxID=1969805 RepID=UPI001182639D|nr:hypothetical protein [Catellatospora sichuanensis]
MARQLDPFPEKTTAADLDRSAPELHLTRLDLIAMIALSTAAFALGPVLQTMLDRQPADPVAARVDFDAEHGVLAAKEELALTQAQLAKVHEALAEHRVGIVSDEPPQVTATASPALSPAAHTTNRLNTVMRLDALRKTLATEQIRQQLALSKATTAAERKHGEAVKNAASHARGLRAAASTVALATLLLTMMLLNRWVGPLTTWPVVLGALALLALLVVADATSWWVAGAGGGIALLVAARRHA